MLRKGVYCASVEATEAIQCFVLHHPCDDSLACLDDGYLLESAKGSVGLLVDVLHPCNGKIFFSSRLPLNIWMMDEFHPSMKVKREDTKNQNGGMIESGMKACGPNII